MVHNYSGRTRIAIAAIALVALLLVATTAVAIGAEGDEIELTIGTSGLDPLSQEKAMGSGPFCRLGQRLTIPDRLVTVIGYRVWKVGNPTGDVIFSIREMGNDRVIVSVVWGDASELPDPEAGGIRKVRLDEPVRVNGEVILCVEYYGGDLTDYCVAGYRTNSHDHDYRAGETYMNYYPYGHWHDIGEREEGGYYYAYIDEGAVDPPPNEENGENGKDDSDMGDDNATGWIITGSALGALVIGGGLMIRRERRKQRTS